MAPSGELLITASGTRTCFKRPADSPERDRGGPALMLTRTRAILSFSRRDGQKNAAARLLRRGNGMILRNECDRLHHAPNGACRWRLSWDEPRLIACCCVLGLA